MKRKPEFLSFILLFACVAAAAQQSEAFPEPAWVYLKRGERAFQEREYGDALKYFRIALGKQEIYPEADVGIGMVFQEEGEYSLAEAQYLEAVAHRDRFGVPEDYYATLYRLSEIYRTQRKYRDYDEVLNKVLAEDALHVTSEQKTAAAAMGRTVHERTLDKVVELYRSPVDFSLRAYRDLGVFYYETGRYASAVQHLTVAAVKIFTGVIDERKRMDPEYRYESVSRTLDDGLAVPVIRDFLTSQEVFRVLYYLGASLYAETRSSSVGSIWSLVIDRKEAGVWAARAGNQKKKPFIEPVLAQ